MKVQCCNCLKKLGEKEPLADESTTHGLCKKCFGMLRIQAMLYHGPMTAKEIRARTGLTHTTTWTYLQNLIESGVIGEYSGAQPPLKVYKLK